MQKNEMINIKTLDPYKIKLDEKSYWKIVTYYINYETKNSAKPLYLIINEINGTLKRVMKIDI